MREIKLSGVTLSSFPYPISLIRHENNQIFMDPCIVDDSIEIPKRCSFVIEFIIPKFIEGSTCFKRQTVHRS
jgi:hypothetical protein